VTDNLDGTYSVTASLPVPLTASGTGQVVMEGHPAGQDADGRLDRARPGQERLQILPITDTSNRPRRQIVSAEKCMSCHRSDGTGAAPQLTCTATTGRKSRRCASCVTTQTTPTSPSAGGRPRSGGGSPRVSGNRASTSRRWFHGIHASTTGFREQPLVVIAFNHTVFDSEHVGQVPGRTQDCVTCHIDNRSKGTFELPLSPDVLGSTFDTGTSIGASGAVTIDTDPTNDVKISPTAAVCSSCHDGERKSITWSRPAELHSARRRRSSTAEWSWSAVSGATVRARRCLFAGCTKLGNPSVLEGARVRPSGEITAGSRGRPVRRS